MTQVKLKYFSSATNWSASNVAAGDLCYCATGNFAVGGTSYTAPCIIRVSGVSGSTINGTVFKGTDTNTWPSVTNNSASLAAAGSSATIATIGSTAITVTTPSSWKLTDTTYSAGEGLSLSGTQFINDGVLSIGGYDGSIDVGDGLIMMSADESGNNPTILIDQDSLKALLPIDFFPSYTGSTYITVTQNPLTDEGEQISYTISATGLATAGHSHTYPVTSVNTKTGAVSLTYSDVSAASAGHSHSYSDVGAASAGHTHSGAEQKGVTTSVRASASATDTVLPTEKAVRSAIDSALTSALKYKGTTATKPTASGSTGDVYVMSATAGGFEPGDYFICRGGTTWDAVNGENQVSASVASNATGVYTIGVVDGTTLYGVDTNTTYSAGTGLTLSGTQFSNTGVTSIASKTGAISLGSGLTMSSSGEISVVGSLTDNNDNQTVKVGSTTFGVNDAVNITAGTNVTVTANTTNKTITIAATDTTYSAGTGIALNGTTFSNTGVLSVAGASNSNVTASTSNGAVTVDLNWIEY